MYAGETRPRRNGSGQGVKLPSLEGQQRSPGVFGATNGKDEFPLMRASQQLPPLQSGGEMDQPPVSGPKRTKGNGGTVRGSMERRSRTTAVVDIEPDFHGEIVTGTDVVEYFATFGHDARIKVFHCNQRYGRHEGSPYELLVVPRDKVNKEYYTMTASGVVYVPGDPNFETEFIPIGEWLRETSIYNLMRTLRFFKYYFTQKMFRIWRKNAQSWRYQRVKEKLQNRLFMAKPDFCKCIMDLRGLLFELSCSDLVEINTETAHQLSDLVADQTEHRKSKMFPLLERLVQRIVHRVWVHCQDVSTTEVRMRKEVQQAAKDPSNGATKGASTTRIKMERMEQAKRHRQLVKDVALLANLVRLADYMLVESSVQLLATVAEKLHQLFSSHPVFITSVAFTEDGVFFSPTDEEVLHEFNTKVMDRTVEMLKTLPRVLEEKKFAMLFEPPIPRGPDPTAIIVSTRALNSSRRSCDMMIKKSFSKAAEYAAVFEEVRMVQHFKAAWDEKEYKAVKRDIEAFRQDMMLMKQWSDDVEAMKVAEAVGVLHVDSKGLQGDLQGTLNKALDVLKQLLTVAARKQCLSVLEQFSKLEKKLGDRPVKLEEFASFYDAHVKLSESQDEYTQQNQVVLDMYGMLTTYGGKVPPNDQLNLDDLKDVVAAFGKAMEESANYIDERKSGMISMLQKNIKEMYTDLAAVVEEMHSGKYDKADKSPRKMMEHVKELTKNFKSCKERSERFHSYETLFGLQNTDFAKVEQANKELTWHANKWTYLYDFIKMSEEWYSGNCASLDPEKMQNLTDEYTKLNYKMGKQRKDDAVVQRLSNYLDEFKINLPLLIELANPALEGRHWEQIFQIMGSKYTDGMRFTPRDLIDNGIIGKMEEVQVVCAGASKEYSMLKTLEKMEVEFAPVEFRTMPYKDSGTFVLGGIDEIQLLLDDQIVKVQAMNASPFVKPFLERAKKWEKTLITMQDLLDNWLKCQSTWLYLEPIFSSDDIVKQMPEEGEKFRQVDSMWRALQKRTNENPNAVDIAQEDDRLEKLIEANELLEAIQKGLAAYLEKKRLFFPRFFFLSNDEMLEILSETKDPTRVQPHLKKCFEGVDQLEFQEDLTITAMISVEKESVPFKVMVDTNKARGSVEKWLVEVEERMFQSIHYQTQLGLEDYAAKPRHEWVLQWPGMVVLVVTGMFWTTGVEAALKTTDIKEVDAFEKQCTSDLMKIVDLVRGNLTKLERATLGALVVMDVHARDVVTKLVEDKVTSVLDFNWQAQLRTSWENDEEGEKGMTTMMRMMSAQVEYGYEYLGNSSRLVITPLTDRCYRTLIGAIHLTLGGAPEGPAGTGKTETTKDLAKALARQCVVFNCSDSLDYIAMGKFFKGLASSGAWACFDEFNRIDLEVLSVVAQQVLDIQRAVGQRLRRFVFEGTEMQLKWSAWCSITMNPGYAGRSELPDNLKALFRTVAMMVPDYAMISEIILYSNGYLAARDCAKKIVQCYKLCSEQLSSQDHYDYGMRAVIAVLRAAGNLKRRFPDEDEYVLMLRSIIDVNLCKFLSHDVPLFQGIISDLFPGVVLPKPDYNLMEEAMRVTCTELNLQPTDYFFLKTIQLYEMIVVRHGLMIVGLPFSGKTCSYRVLAGALTKMKELEQEGQERTEYHVINPKSITMGQLYGQFDPVSHEWTDGILAITFRACASNPSPDRKWLLLDGPVDAIWIENMNTVLDDNKKLCLNSGEIIQMSAQMNMIFEVMDLAVASPATVSRCGMVYLEPHQLGWRPLCLSWLNTLPAHLPQDQKAHLLALLDWLVPVTLRFNRREIKEGAPTLDSNMVTTLMRVFTSMTDHFLDAEKFAELSAERVALHVESIFLFALTWSLGATSGNAEGRASFDQFIRAAVSCALPDYTGPSGEKYTLPEDIPEGHTTLNSLMIPNDNGTSIYEWMFDVEKDQWVTWESIMDTNPIDNSLEVRKIIVPTIDTVRYTFLVDIALEHEQPILLVGPTGTGKSVYMMKHLFSMDQEKYASPIVVGFSARTTANMTQYLIDAKLDRRRKGIFGPPAGKKVCIFVDDLNMPQLETYGAQPPIELLRQYMDHEGWYDRQNTFRKMVDCMFCAAMGPPGGGRSNITPRYQRHFNLISVVDFDLKTLSRIFVTIVDWYMVKESFPENITAMKEPLINATTEVYTTVMGQLLPTPTKSHYTFNLRDIARVMQGLLLIKKNQLGSGAVAKEKFQRLWTHEILRVFYDRLVDMDDCNWFLSFLKETFTTHFQDDLDRVFRTLADGQPVTTDSLRRLFFGSYMSEEEEQEKRVYDEVTDVEQCMSKMEELLMDHNATSKKPMNLAVFLYAVEHISRICRVIKQPGGHMLNVGLGGSGRQSLTRLSAYICGMETFQIEISKSYTTNEWREDLKRFTRAAGANNCPCVFLFSDSQIKYESFVEDINNLLNSGEVPNMFPYDERAAVLESCRIQAKKDGLGIENPTDLWLYFVDRTRANLHIVLCFSPIGDAFRERLRQFPSLVNCCTIDWFQVWPKDALEAVALKFLKEVDISEKQRHDIMEMCEAFHVDVRHLAETFLLETGRTYYLTPTSYLELITMFTSLLTLKRNETEAAKRRYKVGLDKLEFTAGQVKTMQEELTALKPNLERTVKETDALMAKVSKEKAEVVEPKKAVVDKEVEKAKVAADAANAIKSECEEALGEAMPILNSAIAALNTIKPADIKLVQSFKNPPATIKLVLEAVCVILQVKPARVKDPNSGQMVQDYWESSKKLLADPNFVNNLKEYDKDNIPPKVIEAIRKQYTSNPEFTPQNAAKASSAAEGMCKWVFAMDSYDKVAKVVAPKQASLAVAQEEYDQVMVELNAKEADLKEVMDKLATMEAQLEASTKEKMRLEAEVELCTQKLDRAEKLIGGLGGEKARWTEVAAQLGVQYTNLTGDMLISAGVISYLGAFTMIFRDRIIGKWVELCKNKGIPSSKVFSLQDCLGDPVRIREWGIHGLPNDSFSIDNGIMVANARRWPLMIDPQGQANKWVKSMEKDRDLRVIKLTDGDYLRTLENAVQFGIPVLLENVGEELDPSLEPLLLKQIFKQGGVNYIRMGDATVEFSDQFRFYITTTLRNPHYLPETAVKVTLLNFMITQEGLSDQLLGVVVAEERPDLESQRQKLVVESAENKRRLKEIEDKILHVLSSSEGNILEDASAIEILSDAKVVSNEIQEKELVAEETRREIDAARVGYRPCGAFNSVLFFCVRDMAGIDPMYQYSLGWFINLFVRAIQGSTKTDDLQARLKHINDAFTYNLYQNICRSLFEKDKLLFSFLLDSRILLSEGKLDGKEYNFLLTGGVGVAEKDLPNPAGWIETRAWGEICRLANVSPELEKLPEDIAGNQPEWKKIFDSVEPHLAELPMGWQNKATHFQRVMILRCLRPDKVVPAIQDFVGATLGQPFVEPPPFDLEGSFKESSVVSPLLFVLSPGSDPTAALLKFADDRGFGSKVSVISMGQGQGPKAAALIEEAIKNGTWALLQNCHLAASWMPILEKIVESIKVDTTDPDFRLWLTSMPSPHFPVTILQNGVKMTNEPPAGVRANLKRSYMLDPISDPEFFGQSNKPTKFKALLFGLCFVHAFVQERRKFGAIGWNIPYGFDDGDLRISVRQLRMYVDENEEVPFAALKYAIGECNYGGRVTDDKDRRLLNTLLDQVYCPRVLNENCQLSASGVYYVPEEGEDLAHYTNYINSLPIVHLPEVFGLHDNADISKDQQNTQLMFDTLLLAAGSAGGGGAGGEEELVGGLVKDILKKMPADFDIEKAQYKYPVKYEESMNQVLCQEMLRYNRLTGIIRNSLVNLEKAIAGLQVMSGELEKVFRSMAIGQVPDLWKGKSFPSLKPLGSYIEDLFTRLKMLQDWYEHGQPSTFWLPGFFFTPSFTTAALQNYARRHKLPIDVVGYDFEMLGVDHEEYTTPPEDGIYVYGMFLDGCAWDKNTKQLCESKPKVLYVPAPVIYLKPMKVEEFGKYDHYSCPVYRTPERKGVLATTGHSTNFLMMVRLPTDQPEHHWILRGVCMLCSLTF